MATYYRIDYRRCYPDGECEWDFDTYDTLEQAMYHLDQPCQGKFNAKLTGPHREGE